MTYYTTISLCKDKQTDFCYRDRRKKPIQKKSQKIKEIFSDILEKNIYNVEKKGR